jgi:hypothetical protein
MKRLFAAFAKATTTRAAAPQLRQLSTEELRRVAAAGPKGTWSEVQSASSVNGPKGTW